MIFYSYLKRIKNNISASFCYYHALISSIIIPKGNKRVYLEIDKIIPNRYLYNFVKFFKNCGYTIYLPKNKGLIFNLNNKKGEFLYSSWILKEGIKLGKPRKPYFSIDRGILSNAYFNVKEGQNEYHVPMSEYPALYFKGIKAPSIKKAGNRKNSVFMSGNIDPRYYDKISKSPFFSILSRLKVYEYLKKKSELYQEIKSYKDLSNFILSDVDGKIIIIDCSEHFRIPIKEVKNILVNFNFYLGLPGMVMPQSHNIIEAMSIGCIPIIHSTYAKTFNPNLMHLHNAFIYEDMDELERLIVEAINMDSGLIQEMQDQVLKYYAENLSPQAVVKQIENKDFSKIYIQAETASLKLFKERD